MRFFKTYFFLLVNIYASVLLAQDGIIRGQITDAADNAPIPLANIVLQGTSVGTVSDVDGYYEISSLEPGLYNLEVVVLGYKSEIEYEIQVYNNRPATINFSLESFINELDVVEIRTSPFRVDDESPVSIRSIGVNEIARYPGGNRDISKVIQSLPGVSSTVSFRNDILIRGGSPLENSFYIDDIEVPTINHFSTQGATGGPVGLVNIDFIREVDFYSGAFPVNKSNALSSVMDIKLIDGRTDRPGISFTVGASETALSFESPLKEKGSMIFSVRRSYLQLLFKLFELPFLPTYNDFQFKSKVRINQNNELVILGLAAIDNLELNLDANETEDQRYILGNLPDNDQWNYTWGVRHKLFMDDNYWTFVVSQSVLNNTAIKYENNEENDPDKLVLDYESREMENKFRAEQTFRKSGWKWSYGVAYEWIKYTNRTFNKIFVPDVGPVVKDFSSKITMHVYSAFGNASKKFLNERLSVSVSARVDGASYNEFTVNPLRQFSPRIAVSYMFNEFWKINTNMGIYYQLPPYTLLGYRDNNGALGNEDALDYINNRQFVLGMEYLGMKNAKWSVEGFLKLYDRYPFLLTDSISFANQGGDFGVVGNELANSSGEGRAYGLEVLFQQKLYKGWYGIVAYTLYWSEFKDKYGQYVASSWDNRHIISITGGKKFNKNWEVGFRWGISGGAPYTPYDIEASSITENWDRTGEGILDYDQLNAQRLPWFHQLDVRIDKKWFFKSWSLNLYLDIQNAYNFQATYTPYVNVRRDANGNPIRFTSTTGPDRYAVYLFDDITGQVLPSIGLVIKI